MRKKPIYIILVILLCIAAAVVYTSNTIYRVILAEEETSLDDHLALLEPFLVVERPPGSGATKVPVAVIIPGCLHTISHNPAWQELFLEEGYATVILDSFTPRGLKTEEQLLEVCLLRRVPGFDRAGDIYAVLHYLKNLDWVDGDRIVLAGWSHAGWAVMDAMAFSSRNESPYNVKEDYPEAFDGVSHIFLLYPHCGFGTEAKQGFIWDKPIPTLLLSAGKDTSVNPSHCSAWYAKQHNPQLHMKLFQNAQHTFDIPAPFNRNLSRFSEEYTKKAMDEVRILLQQ